jgi:TetR/AcrR family transcriptional repressor of mexJK operon
MELELVPKNAFPANTSSEERADSRTERLTDRLLDAATQFFMEKGFEATNVGEIARLAHASKETFYRHFPTKEELFRAVILRRVARNATNVEAVMASKGSLTETLIAFGEFVLERLITPETIALHRILSTQHARFPDLAKAIQENGRGKMVAILARYLDGQVAKKTLRKMNSNVAARQLLDLIVAEMIMRSALGISPIPTKAEHHDRVKEAVDCFLNGYAASGEPF